NLIPAVLGTRGEVVDLGRTTRLFTTGQVKALRLRHPHCQGHGCDRPASHCEAHHHHRWLDGGPTDLTNALLLCSRCHHRAHDPRLTTEVTDNGEVHFTPRGGPP
uniref:HNH endonuclease signature motif containing protein n=1 Tax=Nocardioides sp. TaxID=35761 RepID=UPI002626073E